ncbi:membrane protein [Virgisporangium aliadipatigenens]|uniref:Membrane protein n=1 Tax=Virgisporangium aliadipatigenens TaxID=741659 RepID=A0A8J3YLW1_9ACTN|nr:PLD nuclease N-terminal domain-containing protein [Virgisporangium aliadipatigenens]GIJ47894.1 membrane protein [Virgisporangium aliadipatigenens]
MDWTFGTFLWATLVVFFWFAVAWSFICVFGDILRREMSGWAKAGWMLLIVFLPFFGALAYIVARPAEPIDTRPLHTALRGGGTPDDDLAARLRDDGRLSPAEYERLRRQAALRARSV